MRKLLLNIMFVVFFAVGGFSLAYATIIKTENPKDFADRVASRIIEIVESSQSNDRKQDQLVEIFNTYVDTDWMAKFVMGKYYRQMNDSQKDEYRSLYREFVIYSYIPRFREYSGEKIKFYDSIKQSAGEYIVKSALKTPQAQGDVLVDYRVKRNGQSYKIVDIIGEGVSLITTQRSDFAAPISKKGVDFFIDRLGKKVASLKNKSFD